MLDLIGMEYELFVATRQLTMSVYVNRGVMVCSAANRSLLAKTYSEKGCFVVVGKIGWLGTLVKGVG